MLPAMECSEDETLELEGNEKLSHDEEYKCLSDLFVFPGEGVELPVV